MSSTFTYITLFKTTISMEFPFMTAMYLIVLIHSDTLSRLEIVLVKTNVRKILSNYWTQLLKIVLKMPNILLDVYEFIIFPEYYISI